MSTFRLIGPSADRFTPLDSTSWFFYYLRGYYQHNSEVRVIKRQIYSILLEVHNPSVSNSSIDEKIQSPIHGYVYVYGGIKY